WYQFTALSLTICRESSRGFCEEVPRQTLSVSRFIGSDPAAIGQGRERAKKECGRKADVGGSYPVPQTGALCRWFAPARDAVSLLQARSQAEPLPVASGPLRFCQGPA